MILTNGGKHDMNTCTAAADAYISLLLLLLF